MLQKSFLWKEIQKIIGKESQEIQKGIERGLHLDFNKIA